MCGIVGLAALHPDRRPDRETVEAMTSSMAHRGPDAQGIEMLGEAALGHRRLSIIDLEGGAQPLFNEDRSVAIAFNGEIYNHAQLRKRLIQSGHRFATDHSDTETIVHLYEEMGVKCLDELNGMFALAIWDGRNRRMFCARDRMGQKPLYYAVIDGQLAVASELKALMRHPRLRREIDRQALSAYLALEYIPAPRSILKGARKLPAGHYFDVCLDDPPQKTDDIQTRQYWNIPFAPEPRSDERLCAELIDQLRAAVERRLIADVPLGVFLSGGIDSSAIVAMMADLMPARDIRTFTIAFEESTFDESEYAQLAAKHFGTDHNVETMPASRVIEEMPRVAEILDEPFADPSIMPTHLLCGFTRRHVTVALGGDGGDELFAGYDPFAAHAAGRIAAAAPKFLQQAALALANRLPTSHRNISFDFKAKRFLAGVGYPPARRHWAWMGSFPPAWQSKILSEDVLEQIDSECAWEAPDRYWAESTNCDDVNRVIYQYCKLYLQDDILTKVDRASMAHSLEARSPMLDPQFVEWCGTVPPDRKLRGKTRKYILKKALRGRVPDAIIDRPKKGFGMPIAAWLGGPLQGWMEERLGEESIRKIGLFRPAAIRRIMDEHLSGKADRRKELWTLLAFVEWHDRHLGS